MEAIANPRAAARRPGAGLGAETLLGIGALVGWAALVVVAGAWGANLRDEGARIGLGAAPLFGSFDLEAGAGIAAPILIGGAIAIAGPLVAARLRWRALLWCCIAAALAWPLALAVTHGVAGINQPLEGPSDYLASLPLIHSAADFLAGFGEHVGNYSTHVRSHPPGMALLLVGLDRIGLGGSWAAAAVILAAASTTVVAVLIAMRSVAGAAAARRAAPFVILAPGAVWIATTADALFMAVGAWAVALVVVSIGERGRRSDMLALAGGLLFGITAFLSFGLVLLAAIPVVVAVARRRIRPLLLAAATGAIVALPFLAAGYWWLDGYQIAREQYRASIATSRPYDFFSISDLAAFALALGPAIALGLVRLRDRGAWLLVGAGLLAVAFADLSGMSKGEVERIWLPFLPWVLLAATALPQRLAAQRVLLGVQAACAIAIEVGVATIW